MKKITPLSAIRKFCIQCQGGNQKAPTLCASIDCSLYAYRLGKNPARKGIGGKISKQGRKQNGEGICAIQVGKTERIIEVSGNKRVIIKIEDI
jgi:hypothetical protein